MFFKRSVSATIAVGSIAVVIASVVALTAYHPETFSLFSHQPQNSLSGRTGGDGPVLVVKIDDTNQAHPQVGLSSADLVYIEQVEGGLTRLAAVYSSKIPSSIGPVRSARISDIDILAQFGRVGFAYSGAQKLMRPVIAAANLEDLGAQTHSSTIYTTDQNRVPPYAMILRADRLMEFVASKELALATSKSVGWNFGAIPEGGRSLTSAHISWPAASYDVNWSASANTFLLDHNRTPNMDADGKQLRAATFVVQLVSITDSIYKDKVGGITPFSQTVGEGKGYILRNGKIFQARWSRLSAESGTEWRTPSGKEITFERGPIWIALTSKEPVIAYATTQSGK